MKQNQEQVSLFNQLEQEKQPYSKLLRRILKEGLQYSMEKQEVKVLLNQINSHFLKSLGVYDFYEILINILEHLEKFKTFNSQAEQIIKLAENIANYYNKKEFQDTELVKVFDTFLEKRMPYNLKQSIFSALFDTLSPKNRAYIFFLNTRYITFLADEQQALINSEIEIMLKSDKDAVEELIKYMEYCGQSILRTRWGFILFIQALNGDFLRYESKGIMGDLLEIWMHSFFEFDLATHSNPIFHTFCENIFRLTNDPFPGSAISEIYSEYVKSSVKTQNRKELIRFLLQRLNKIEPFYMMELIDIILYNIQGEGCWEVFDDDALKFLTDAIRQAELIETAYEGLLVFAQVLDTLITAPIFSKVSRRLSEILHTFIIDLRERKSMNKRIPSELYNVIAQMPTASQKVFRTIPGFS